MISLKKIVRSILSEGPEYFMGLRWGGPGCLGPAIIYDDLGKCHYAFGNLRDETLVVDGKVKVSDEGFYTHDDITDIIHIQNPHEFPNIRLWNIKGKIVVSMWVTPKEVNSFGLEKFLDALNRLVKDNKICSSVEQIFFNPYEKDSRGNLNDKTFSYAEFVKLVKGNVSNVDNKERDIHKALHLLSPDEKKKALKKIGGAPKVSQIPDFMKKQLAGVDESK